MLKLMGEGGKCTCPSHLANWLTQTKQRTGPKTSHLHVRILSENASDIKHHIVQNTSHSDNPIWQTVQVTPTSSTHQPRGATTGIWTLVKILTFTLSRPDRPVAQGTRGVDCWHAPLAFLLAQKYIINSNNKTKITLHVVIMWKRGISKTFDYVIFKVLLTGWHFVLTIYEHPRKQIRNSSFVLESCSDDSST